jgi:hypothetical protein
MIASSPCLPHARFLRLCILCLDAKFRRLRDAPLPRNPKAMPTYAHYAHSMSASVNRVVGSYALGGVISESTVDKSKGAGRRERDFHFRSLAPLQRLFSSLIHGAIIQP